MIIVCKECSEWNKEDVSLVIESPGYIEEKDFSVSFWDAVNDKNFLVEFLEDDDCDGLVAAHFARRNNKFISVDEKQNLVEVMEKKLKLYLLPNGIV